MCGIAGIIQQDKSRFGKEHLKKMTDTLAHRGPEGEGLWQNAEGHTLLGHRRLCIIDLSDAAAQPMHYRDNYSIVHNGEIYNYIELRKELEKEGYTFRTQSDTEVILAAYDHWNDECVEHFDGMFAFAIWDEQEKELFVARDRFGEKPLFYSFEDNCFFFASEMKALRAAGIQHQPNLQLLFNFLTIGYVDNPAQPDETFFTNIKKLPPASFLYYSLEDNEVVVEKYWDIDPDKKNKKITDTEAIEQFNHLFTTSVQRRLRSDVEIGTSLSGGLDSASVITTVFRLTHTNQGKPLSEPQAFTAVFPGFEKDETAYATHVAHTFRLRHHTVEVTAEGLLQDWDRMCQYQEEPFGSASIYAQYKVFELANNTG
jgi:asparagine synthase (glutamine-hydrolysing)